MHEEARGQQQPQQQQQQQSQNPSQHQPLSQSAAAAPAAARSGQQHGAFALMHRPPFAVSSAAVSAAAVAGSACAIVLPSPATVIAPLRHARNRWLKPAELQALLQHARASGFQWQVAAPPSSASTAAPQSTLLLPLLSTCPPVRPRPGSVYLYNKTLITKWRKDQYTWQGGDRHNKLKLHGADILTCYYAKCAESTLASAGGEVYLGALGSFQRRAFCLLGEGASDIVLVQYLDDALKGAAVATAAAAAANAAASSALASATGVVTPVKMEDSAATPSALAPAGRSIDLTSYLALFPSLDDDSDRLPATPLSSKQQRERGPLVFVSPPPANSAGGAAAAAAASQFHQPSINQSLQLHRASSMDTGDSSPLHDYSPSADLLQPPRRSPLAAPNSLSSLLLPTAFSAASASSRALSHSTTTPFHQADNPYSPRNDCVPVSHRSTSADAHPASPLQQLLMQSTTTAAAHFQTPSTAPFHLQQPQQQHSIGSIMAQSPRADSSPAPPSSLTVLDYAPSFDSIDGGSKMLLCLSPLLSTAAAAAAASPSSPQPLAPLRLFLHFLCTTAQGAQLSVGCVPADRVGSADSFVYRACIPAVARAGRNYQMYLSDAEQASQCTVTSQMMPFEFREKQTASDPAAAAGAPPLLRPRSRSYVLPLPVTASAAAPSMQLAAGQRRLQLPTAPAAVTAAPPPSSSAASGASANEERDVIVALFRRLQEMDRAVAAQTFAAASASATAAAAAAQQHLRQAHSSPLGFQLSPTPLMSLLMPSSQSHHTALLSPSQLPFHLQHSPPFSTSPGDGRINPRSPSPSPSAASLGAAPAAVSCALTLSDVEACLLDDATGGEDLVESLLLVSLRKIMEADAKYSSMDSGAAATTHEPHSGRPGPACSPMLISCAAARDSEGRQLVHYVSALGYTSLLSVLLSQLQANVNSQDARGRTPLHHAALSDAEGDAGASAPAALMVSALLSFGADDRLVDRGGSTALALADQHGCAHVVQVFLEVQNAESMGDEEDARERSTKGNRSSAARSSIAAASAASATAAAATVALEPQEPDSASGDDECEEEGEGRFEDDDDDDDAMYTGQSVAAGSAAAVSSSSAAAAASSSASSSSAATAAVAASSSSAASSSAPSSSSFPLDRAFSSLTLSDMGISATALAAFNVPDGPDLFSTDPEAFSSVVRKIQRQIRWWLFRRHMAANKLQSVARGMLARRSIKRMRESAVTIQTKFRTRKVRKEFVQLKKATKVIQDRFRGREGAAAGGGTAATNGGAAGGAGSSGSSGHHRHQRSTSPGGDDSGDRIPPLLRPLSAGGDGLSLSLSEAGGRGSGGGGGGVHDGLSSSHHAAASGSASESDSMAPRLRIRSGGRDAHSHSHSSSSLSHGTSPAASASYPPLLSQSHAHSSSLSGHLSPDPLLSSMMDAHSPAHHHARHSSLGSAFALGPSLVPDSSSDSSFRPLSRPLVDFGSAVDPLGSDQFDVGGVGGVDPPRLGSPQLDAAMHAHATSSSFGMGSDEA